MGGAAQGQRDHSQLGKMSFIPQGKFSSCCFSRKVPLPARSHRVLFGFKGNFLLISVVFHWGPVPEYQLGADGPGGEKTIDVKAENVRFLAGSNGCTPLKQPSMLHSHPQMNEIIKFFFFFALVYCVVQLSS